MKRLVFLLFLLPFFSVQSARASTDNDTDNFRPDVLMCEEALAQLQACCPGFVTTAVLCTYQYSTSTGGCDFTTTVRVMPAFNETESRCILESSCDVLRDAGTCGRAQTATEYVSVSRDSIDAPDPGRESSTHPPVCP